MIWLWIIGYILLCIVNLFLWMLFFRLEDGELDIKGSGDYEALTVIFIGTPISFPILICIGLAKYGGKLMLKLVEIIAERIEDKDAD